MCFPIDSQTEYKNIIITESLFRIGGYFVPKISIKLKRMNYSKTDQLFISSFT
jgi:hypothetical protein